MKREALFLGTAAMAVAEWLMFELLRTPYRPPGDMLTLLGVEKFGLAAMMIAAALPMLLRTLTDPLRHGSCSGRSKH